jgi:DNA-binding NtrC family response regulator
MAKILIIEDGAAIRRVLVKILSEENNTYLVEEAEDGLVGMEKIKDDEYDLVLCDIKMPKMDGIEVLEKLKEKNVESPVIMISGHGTVETAVEALKKGAFDFIQKPLDLNRILVTLRNALDQSSLIEETKVLRQKVNKKFSSIIVGESEPIMKIKDMIETVAPTDARVMITGANGTGKELVARQLHEKSSRAKGRDRKPRG